MKPIFNTILLSLILFNTQAQDLSKKLKGIDKELESILEICEVAGFAVAVVSKDEVIYSKGFGYRDLANKTAVTENTSFAIGSCTKSFTSSLIGLLEKEDKLSLSDSPTKHIPSLTFNSLELNNSITIEDMMCHRTGLPRHDYSWYLFPSQSKDSLLMRLEYQEATMDIRTAWQYNNFMFLTQGVIVEKITGKSWEKNVQDRFFTPLGMNSSTSSISGLKHGSEASLGYYNNKEGEIIPKDYYNIAGMSPAGAINSSVQDMSKWLITWINNGKYQEKQIIPSSYVQEAISQKMSVGSGLPSSEYPDVHFGSYGYAWFMASYKGHYRVEHGGNIDGFSASTCFFPSDSVGIVVLANQDRSVVPRIVRNIIADRLLGVQRSDWLDDYTTAKEKRIEAQAGDTTDISTKVENTKPSHAITEYTGTFENLGYGRLRIELINDSLILSAPNDKIYLKHFHYDVFEPFEYKNGQVEQSLSLKVSFISDINGEISSIEMPLEMGIDPIEFDRVESIISVGVSDLEKYIGNYELPGIVAVVSIKEEALRLFIKGQPEYELKAIGNDRFKIGDLEGFNLEFVKGDKNDIVAIKFIQPNGTFRAEKAK